MINLLNFNYLNIIYINLSILFDHYVKKKKKSHLHFITCINFVQFFF